MDVPKNLTKCHPEKLVGLEDDPASFFEMAPFF